MDLNSGCYLLLIRLDRGQRLTIGALGEVDLPAGCYLYTGRARRNLRQRVARHFHSRKKIRWHIDYLLQAAVIEEARLLRRLDECALAREMASLHGAKVISGFGSSDCRCPGHLVHMEFRPDLSDFDPVFEK